LPPDDDYDLHDEQDATRLRELARLTRAGGDRRRIAILIGELIEGWRPHYRRWLEVRHGPEVAENVDGRVQVKLTELLLRTQEFDMPWGAVVWVNVKRYALGDEQRDRARHAKAASTDELAEVLPDTDTAEQLDAAEGPDIDADRLRRSLARLDPKDREVLELCFYENLCRQELAERLDVTPGNAGVIKHRAVASLIESWNAV
jgi:RNA polymerase sigma factor (sigma-70 family)